MFLKEHNIPMAEGKLVRKKDNIDIDGLAATIGLPCFIKPNDSGSSFGVSKVKNKAEIMPAFEKVFKGSDEAIIEAFMNGKEAACGVVILKNKTLALPVTEIISKNEFFDYEAKYTPGKANEITPANFSKEVTEEIQRLGVDIAKLLGCSGMARVDFIIVDSKPYFLEINTVPGMTRESIIPKQAKAAGLSTSNLYSMIIEDVLSR
jgi:D-alanine-D-alanine ligase